MTPQQIEEFDKQFGTWDKDNEWSVGRIAGCDDCEKNNRLRDEHKQFITTLLEKQREEIERGLIEYAYEFITAEHFNRTWFESNVKNYFKNHHDKPS